MTAPGVWPFLPRRRRERTIAGGTRAFFSAYHRNNEAHENRTLNRVRGFLAPRWGADSYWNHHPGVTLAALANPRLISRYASGVAKTAKLQALAGLFLRFENRKFDGFGHRLVARVVRVEVIAGIEFGAKLLRV